MAKSDKAVSTADVLAKTKSKGNRGKKSKAPKKTPSFARYKAENRAYHHQIAQIEKHLSTHPTDSQSVRRLQSIKDTRYQVTR